MYNKVMADVLQPVFSGILGTPIEIVVNGPSVVKPGEDMVYEVKVRDIDSKNTLNPSGIDWSTAVEFKVTSMGTFNWFIPPNPDGEGYLVCSITGTAQLRPGTYRDFFRGLNRGGGLFAERPVDVVHVVTIKAD